MVQITGFSVFTPQSTLVHEEFALTGVITGYDHQVILVSQGNQGPKVPRKKMVRLCPKEQ